MALSLVVTIYIITSNSEKQILIKKHEEIIINIVLHILFYILLKKLQTMK